jgi:galactose oxidase
VDPVERAAHSVAVHRLGRILKSGTSSANSDPSAPAQVAYGATFPVTTANASQIATVSLIRLGSVTHGFDSNQRYLALTFSATGGALNVQAPANANQAPPGDYMLFIVDTNGVPSVAAFVKVQ